MKAIATATGFVQAGRARSRQRFVLLEMVTLTRPVLALLHVVTLLVRVHVATDLRRLCAHHPDLDPNPDPDPDPLLATLLPRVQRVLLSMAGALGATTGGEASPNPSPNPNPNPKPNKSSSRKKDFAWVLATVLELLDCQLVQKLLDQHGIAG
mmetsp:Transcript_19521/g.59055  ORF Transcript_19521/g.59055 Transcript_19521/m.59055 type:complete len:153 (-) Transcript_19521:85-543(-)